MPLIEQVKNPESSFVPIWDPNNHDLIFGLLLELQRSFDLRAIIWRSATLPIPIGLLGEKTVNIREATYKKFIERLLREDGLYRGPIETNAEFYSTQIARKVAYLQSQCKLYEKWDRVLEARFEKVGANLEPSHSAPRNIDEEDFPRRISSGECHEKVLLVNKRHQSDGEASDSDSELSDVETESSSIWQGVLGRMLGGDAESDTSSDSGIESSSNWEESSEARFCSGIGSSSIRERVLDEYDSGGGSDEKRDNDNEGLKGKQKAGANTISNTRRSPSKGLTPKIEPKPEVETPEPPNGIPVSKLPNKRILLDKSKDSREENGDDIEIHRERRRREMRREQDRLDLELHEERRKHEKYMIDTQIVLARIKKIAKEAKNHLPTN